MKIIRFDKQIKQKWKSRKIPKDFNKIPGSKILGNPVPKNPGIPGFGKISSRKIPGLKFLIPLGPGEMVVDKVADMEVATISNGVATITNEPAVGLLWNLNPDWKFPSYSSLMFRYKLQRKSCKYDFSRQKCYNFVFLQKVLFLLLNKENTALWQPVFPLKTIVCAG